MVAAAVGLVIVTAAMAAFDLQSQFARSAERLLGTQASAGLGMTMMQRNGECRPALPGWRPGGCRRGVGGRGSPLGQPPPSASLKNDPLGTSNVTVVAPPAAGFIPGTDAFEVLMGGAVASAQRLAAQVQLVNPGVAPTRNWCASRPIPSSPTESPPWGARRRC